MSQHQREDQQLAEHIQEVYHSCRQVYGSPRIHAEVREQGIMSSRKRVARLMRERGLSARRRHYKTITTKSEPGARVAPNLRDQDFRAVGPMRSGPAILRSSETTSSLSLATSIPR